MSVPKSRFSTINHYISDHPNFNSDGLDDALPLPYRQEHYDALIEEGVPEGLAKHVARMIYKDAIILFENRTAL